MRERLPPDGFVDLRHLLPRAHFDIRYHSADNFTGAPLPGYGTPGAWMREAAGLKLVAVQAALAVEGLSLLIFDAYRPRRATGAMVDWAERTRQGHLVREGYIARRSLHNLGAAIDLSLVWSDTGKPLDMGTAWDVFDAGSHLGNASGAAASNRTRLHTHMATAGFTPFSKEWWHFDFPLKDAGPIDVPYGIDEPDGRPVLDR